MRLKLATHNAHIRVFALDKLLLKEIVQFGQEVYVNLVVFANSYALTICKCNHTHKMQLLIWMKGTFCQSIPYHLRIPLIQEKVNKILLQITGNIQRKQIMLRMMQHSSV